jgi:hypothetical protein
MADDEKDYYQQRAEAEIVLAQKAEHPDACRSHYLLAGYYLDIVHNEAPADTPEPVIREAAIAE